MEQDSAVIKLSQEEALLILMRYRMPLFVGFPEGILDTPHDRLEIMLGCAERSLFARDYLRVGENNTAQFEPVTVALVSTCSRPEWSLIVLRSEPGQPDESFACYTARKMTVEHRVFQPGVHQFTALAERKMLLERLVSYLNPGTAASPAGLEGTLNEADLMAGRTEAMNHRTAEAAAFFQKGLDPATAEALARSLEGAVANTTLVAMTYPEGNPVGKGFSILQGPDRLWILEPQAGEEGRRPVRVQAAGAQEITAYLAQVIQTDGPFPSGENAPQ